MKRVLIAISLLMLLAIRAEAQTSPSCAQLPNLACAAGDTYTGTHDMTGATLSVAANTIDAITEIAAALKSGADTTLVTGTAGSNGECAQWNGDGDLVTAGAACAAGSNALLDGTAHTDTVAQTVTRGSLIYANSTPAWDELPIGAANTFLHSDGTDAAWAALSASDIGAGDLANALVWAEVCTESVGACTLANAPRVSGGCSADGSGGSILAFSNGLQMKCVDATPGINEYTLSSTTFTFGSTGNSPALVYYER